MQVYVFVCASMSEYVCMCVVYTRMHACRCMYVCILCTHSKDVQLYVCMRGVYVYLCILCCTVYLYLSVYICPLHMIMYTQYSFNTYLSIYLSTVGHYSRYITTNIHTNISLIILTLLTLIGGASDELGLHRVLTAVPAYTGGPRHLRRASGFGGQGGRSCYDR